MVVYLHQVLYRPSMMHDFQPKCVGVLAGQLGLISRADQPGRRRRYKDTEFERTSNGKRIVRVQTGFLGSPFDRSGI